MVDIGRLPPVRTLTSCKSVNDGKTTYASLGIEPDETIVQLHRRRIRELRELKASTSEWKPWTRLHVETELEKDPRESTSFVNKVLEHMREGMALKFISPEWWRLNGFNDRNPVQRRRLGSNLTWVVRTIDESFSKDIGKGRKGKGGKVFRIQKSLVDVYSDFYYRVAQEQKRRREEAAELSSDAIPWLQWDNGVLWSRLNSARYDSCLTEDREIRWEQLTQARTKPMLASLAAKWKLPYVHQNDWIRSHEILETHVTISPHGNQEPSRCRLRCTGESAPPHPDHLSISGMPIPNFGAYQLETGNLTWYRFCDSCHKGDLIEVKRLLRESQINHLFGLDHRDRNQRTTLHTACSGGDLPTVRFLVAERRKMKHTLDGETVDCHSAVWLDAKDENHWTPLFMACWWGHHLVAEFLIRAGANISLRDMNGFSPWERAHMGGKTHVVEHLIWKRLIDEDQCFTQLAGRGDE